MYHAMTASFAEIAAGYRHPMLHRGANGRRLSARQRRGA